MKHARFPADHSVEAQRIAKLASFAILDTPPESEFDTIVEMAQRLLGCPIALVSLVDDHRQWFKARCGLEVSETPKDIAFCAHAILQDDVMVVEDAAADPRFATNPLVTGDLHIRFYAGAPLRPSASGFADNLPALGTLCVIDTEPRTLSAEHAAILRKLAGLVSTLIHVRVSADAALEASIEAREHAMVLDQKHRQLCQAERIAGIGSWRLDLTDQTVAWSDQVFAIHGLPVGRFPTLEEALTFYSREDQARVATLLARAQSHSEAFDFTSDFFTADGRTLRVRSLGEPELVEGEPVAVFGVFQDITEAYEHEQALQRSAHTDALTGLPNRRGFEARLAEAVERARAASAPLGLLILDLDGFKAVNDTFGHDAGDAVLREVSERLRDRAFADTFVARLGGDEFTVMLTRPRDCATLEAIIGTLLGRLHQVIERDGERLAVSATIGGAVLNGPEVDAAELLRTADLALYAAKRDERGTGRMFGGADAIRATVCPAVNEARAAG